MIHEPARPYCTKRWQISANVLSDLKRQVRDAAKEERNLAKKRQRLMQVGEPGTKSKLSLSVANDCGRPPRICRLVTCSSLLQRANQQGFDGRSMFRCVRIMDFPVVHEFAHVWKPSKL